jgi:eukaryotic-like serine/threonine-protein kinase
VKANNSEWIGQEIAEGRYKILGRIGQGSMGHIYCAFDRHLDTDVVLKFPVSSEQGTDNRAFLDRFGIEIRSLVALSHPHIVKIIDVGEFRDLPFVVMQYLAGGSLKDRIATGPRGELEPMPLSSLRDWLPDIARALDFIHSQNRVHRDVKPANILFDRHGNAFLGDFGIIKALTSEATDWRGNSLTAPGFLVGTPNYVAPEVVMGRTADGRVDQYSLAMTVYEILTGNNCMEGPTPSATVVNQTMVVPPPLTEILPDLSKRTSDAILRGLAKNPADRFETCSVLAQEVLAEVPAGSARTTVAPLNGLTSRGEPGRVPCPSCGTPIPAGREHAGRRLRCLKCQAVSYVQILSRNTLQLKLLEHPPVSVGAGSPIVIDAPDDEIGPDPSAVTLQVQRPDGSSTLVPLQARKDERIRNRGWTRRIALGALAVLAITGVFGLGRSLLSHSGSGSNSGGAPRSDPAAGTLSQTPLLGAADPGTVGIHIAYGTEKQKWLEEATVEFAKTPAGRGIKVNLHGMGSVEGAQAVLAGPSPVPIHVWSPASSAYRDLFEQEWRASHKNNPIVKTDNLALTPMVFVMWQDRRDAFIKKYGKVNFKTIGQAMQEPGGWETIAAQPAWGRFKFGHTEPSRSNSGLLTLVLMAYKFANKERSLSLEDVAQQRFLDWLRSFEQAVARPGGSLTHSTGTLMREMVLRGPSQYDCVLVYENLVIDYLVSARDHWGELHVDYPEPNMWNEHPYYILDVPWSDQAQRAAAADFLAFLMSEPIQRQALEHGFRPGNPDVSVRFADSPLLRHAQHGLQIHLPRMCEPPRADTIKKLLTAGTEAEPKGRDRP